MDVAFGILHFVATILVLISIRSLLGRSGNSIGTT